MGKDAEDWVGRGLVGWVVEVNGVFVGGSYIVCILLMFIICIGECCTLVKLSRVFVQHFLSQYYSFQFSLIFI